MTDIITKKLESKLDNKLISKAKRKRLDDGFKKGKVVNEVLDKPTVMTLYKMISDHVIAYVNGAVSAGKESLLFWGVADDDTSVALKVYLVSTCNFRKREGYIVGDPRFSHLRKGTKNLVYLWAKKEFRNLSQCYNAGIPVPKPIHVKNNVLAMEFVGSNDGDSSNNDNNSNSNGTPCKSLLYSQVNHDDYLQAISILHDLYHKAKLVHGDFSEHNIFKTDNGLVVFDLGSGVDIRHPNALTFLKRDVNNIVRFFKKRAVPINDTTDAIYEDIIK